jgi:hypothetical protein
LDTALAVLSEERREQLLDPFDIGGVVSDEAVIWCHRHTRLDWVGDEPPVGPRRYGNEHHALDDGIPQGGRGLARCSRAFLRGRVDPAAGRHMSGRE